MVTRIFFSVVVLALGLQRIFELRTSQRNEIRLKAQNAREHAPRHFTAMKTMHFAWFGAMLGEVYILKRPFIPALSLAAALLLTAGQALRLAAIKTLGPRWTVKIFTLPEEPPVTQGIYRHIRHPNYLGVMLEIAAVPLLHSAFLTAAVFSVINAIILYVRIRAEEVALNASHPQSGVWAQKPRFLPRLIFGSTSHPKRA